MEAVINTRRVGKGFSSILDPITSVQLKINWIVGGEEQYKSNVDTILDQHWQQVNCE